MTRREPGEGSIYQHRLGPPRLRGREAHPQARARAQPGRAQGSSCTGSARFGIEPHEAPVTEFPKQPSRKDGLGTMCTEHWRAYVRGLREARVMAKAGGEGGTASGPEADAA